MIFKNLTQIKLYTTIQISTPVEHVPLQIKNFLKRSDIFIFKSLNIILPLRKKQTIARIAAKGSIF